MSVTTNYDVVVQTANKPKTRAVVGSMTSGCRPAPDDLERWGVGGGSIIEQRWRRMNGRRVYMIVVFGEHHE